MDPRRLETWANELVRAGIPFLDKGRTRAGLDCWGVVRLAYLEVAGLELPSYDDRYANTADLTGMAAVVEDQRGHWPEVARGAEQPGDVVLMRVDGSPVHVGIVLRPGDLLTALRGLGVWVEGYRTMRWAHRVLGFYRLPESPGAMERDAEAQDGLVPVLVRPTPLSDARRALAVPVGTTLAQIVDREFSVALRPYAAVAIDGVLVPPGMLARVRPKAGHRVTLTCVPMNSGGGGGGQKNTGALIAMIGIVIIASVLTWGIGGAVAAGTLTSTEGLVLGLAVSVGAAAAALAVNALMPPPRPKMKELQGATRVSPSILGTQNELRPFGVVPQVLGRVMFFPPYGGIPQREFVWPSDTYVRLVFDLGRGPLRVSQLKIGATPLREHVGIDVKVHNIEVADDPTLTDLTDSPFSIYSNDVDPGDSFAINLAADLPEDPNGNTFGPWYTKRLRIGSGEALVDVAFPKGVGKLDKGQHRTITAEVRIDYAIADSNDWHVLGFPDNLISTSVQALNPDGSFAFDLDTGEPVMITTTSQITDTTRGATWRFTDALWNQPLQATFRATDLDPTKEYEFRFRQEGLVGRGEQTNEALFAEAWLVGLRSVRHVQPITVKGHATIELRIKGTDQLTGVVDTFNLVAETICPDWDAASQTWITRPTQNPASLARFVVQGSANPDPADDDEIDLESLQHWHDFNKANGFDKFGMVVDFAGLEAELLDDICSAGRAGKTLRDGWRFAVVIDEVQPVTRGHFTHRNAWGFTLDKTWADLPHAFRGHMLSEAAGWQVTDRIAFADGYDETNATRYEDFEQLIGVVDGDHAWKLMRYRLAELIQRPERYSFFVDFEHLLQVKGDRVGLAYDVIAVGLGSGRIRALSIAGPNTTGIVLDDAVAMEAGKSYVVAVRVAGGLEQIHPVVTVPGETTALTFQTPVATATGPAVDDLTMFGLAGLATADVVIREIKEGPDDSAQLFCVPYMVNFGDTGPIPAFNPKTSKALVGVARPPTPIIDAVISDESALIRSSDGAIDPQILLACHVVPSPVNLPVAYVIIEMRQTGTTGAPLKFQQVMSGNSARLALAPVGEGITYDLEVYSVTQGGTPSARAAVSAHVVQGRTAPPPDVPELFIEDGVLTWPYPNPPIDLAGFVVRRHFGDRRSWSDAEPLHSGVISETHYPAKLKPLGVMTFLVKAVDSAAPAHESVNAAAIVVNLGGIPIENVIFTRDLKALGWPGTLVGGEVFGEELTALVQGGGKFWSGDDNRPFGSGTPGASYWGDAFEALDYKFSVLPGSTEVPSDLSIFPDATAEAMQIKYRLSGPELYWANDGALYWGADPGAPYWASGAAGEDSWIAWPGKLLGVKPEVHEFRIILSRGPVQGTLHGLVAVLDVPDRVERLANVVFPAGAIRLPITAPFRAITDVQLTRASGGLAVDHHVVDSDPVNGPLVGLVNGAGAFVAGTAVSGSIRGY